MSNTFCGVVTVGKDAEVKFLQSGQAVLTVNCASNTGYGDKKKTMWIRVSLFRKNVESLAQYITKGSQIYVSGELSQNEYQANDGTTKTSMELNANVVDLVGKRENNGQQGQQQGYQPPAQQQRPPVQGNPSGVGMQPRDNFSDYDDSEIPF